MAVLRGERPEVTERVAEAGAALASALRAVARRGRERRAGRRARPEARRAAGAAHRPRRRFEPARDAWRSASTSAAPRSPAGVVDESGRVHRPRTPRHPGRRRRAAPRRSSSRSSTRCARATRSRAVGIGAAGWIANDNATVLFSPHLAWRDEPLRADLERRIDLPLIVENDANAAAWAEYRFGVAAGQPVVVMRHARHRHRRRRWSSTARSSAARTGSPASTAT